MLLCPIKINFNSNDHTDAYLYKVPGYANEHKRKEKFLFVKNNRNFHLARRHYDTLYSFFSFHFNLFERKFSFDYLFIYFC